MLFSLRVTNHKLIFIPLCAACDVFMNRKNINKGKKPKRKSLHLFRIYNPSFFIMQFVFSSANEQIYNFSLNGFVLYDLTSVSSCRVITRKINLVDGDKMTSNTTSTGC
ncbi:hypothetical protein SAY87_028773 [Trapa incisa]|uniref:Uncharacterized protein n=1 Tax=Trapa incisa TaxID=236973 RepID=A0AAN7KWW3_9MYRT|nr:hypothetical protein SAY87_028773 [Trapa incisa]